MRVGLFVSCLVDTLAPQAGRATVEVLERLGHQVVFPEEQTCCGQIHSNSGYPEEAAALARRTIEVLDDRRLEAVVCPSASCTGMLREQYPRLAAELADDRLAARAAALAARVHELSEFLTGVLGVEDVGARFPHRVTYHPTCHGLRGLKLGDGPTRLLNAVRDLELLPLPDAEVCCGFGGTFAVKNSATSVAMLEDKLLSIRASGAEFCVATDCSCLLQIGGGLSREDAPVRTLHLAEVLAAR